MSIFAPFQKTTEEPKLKINLSNNNIESGKGF